jgi:hypothetical protein
MNKPTNPNRMRRLSTAAAGLVVSVIGLCAAAPAAFAMRAVQPDGSTAPVVHHSGTPGWEIALIVIAAVAALGLSLVAMIGSKTHSRAQTPTTGNRRPGATFTRAAR